MLWVIAFTFEHNFEVLVIPFVVARARFHDGVPILRDNFVVLYHSTGRMSSGVLGKYVIFIFIWRFLDDTFCEDVAVRICC